MAIPHSATNIQGLRGSRPLGALLLHKQRTWQCFATGIWMFSRNLKWLITSSYNMIFHRKFEDFLKEKKETKELKWPWFDSRSDRNFHVLQFNYPSLQGQQKLVNLSICDRFVRLFLCRSFWCFSSLLIIMHCNWKRSKFYYVQISELMLTFANQMLQSWHYFSIVFVEGTNLMLDSSFNIYTS